MPSHCRIPVKVAFFLPHFAHGGAEIVVLRLLQGIDRTRFAPLLILQRRRGELLEFVPDDINIIELSPARPPSCILALAQLCRAQDAALLVTVTNATNLYALSAAALQGRDRVATLVTEHTPMSAFLGEAKMSRMRRIAIRMLYPRADLIGGPLAEIGSDLSMVLGNRAPPFVTLPNPVVDRIKSLRKPAVKGLHLVSVGRLASEKRFDLLINAFALLHANCPDLRLTIHGEGRERPALEALIAGLGLKDAVSLPGFSTDLDSIHRQADVFVCSSRREGLGNAIIEAMARGVPVVSVDCPFGPRHLLRDGKAGSLVTQHDAASLSRTLSDVLADRALRARYASAGLEVAQHYLVDAAVQAYQAAFDLALESRRKAAQ